jgi:peptidyl-prolyl cis-trans isomerase A (cyclophilin A)
VLKDPLFDGVMNEASNGLLNVRASVGVARTSDPDSGNSQWYVNTVDNPGLDPAENPPGFTVFGRVVEGMDVVDEIQAVPSESRDSLNNVPVETVLITSVERVE